MQRCCKGCCDRSAGRLEARVGIEPTHKGFADLSLTTWVPRHPMPLRTKFPRSIEGIPWRNLLPDRVGFQAMIPSAKQLERNTSEAIHHNFRILWSGSRELN